MNDIELPTPAHGYGYTRAQVEGICREREIPMDRFWDAFGVNTCMLDEKLGTIYYRSDIERALYILRAPSGKPHLWD
jgi:hypothetical protein